MQNTSKGVTKYLATWFIAFKTLQTLPVLQVDQHFKQSLESELLHNHSSYENKNENENSCLRYNPTLPYEKHKQIVKKVLFNNTIENQLADKLNQSK